MTREAIKQINDLSTGEIKVVKIHSTKNIVDVMLPYSGAVFPIEIYGENTDEQVDSFKEEVNQQLEDMINHLGDCIL